MCKLRMMGTSAEHERGVMGKKRRERGKPARSCIAFFPSSHHSLRPHFPHWLTQISVAPPPPPPPKKKWSRATGDARKVYGVRVSKVRCFEHILFSPEDWASNKNIGDKQMWHFGIIGRLKLSMTWIIIQFEERVIDEAEDWGGWHLSISA